MTGALLLVSLLQGAHLGPGGLDVAAAARHSKPAGIDVAMAGARKDRPRHARPRARHRPHRSHGRTTAATSARPEGGGVPLHAPLTGRLAMEQEDGGSHMRIETNHGPVHLFRPPGFDRKTAGVVVYVHGYYTHIDEAWYEHHLAQQFVASRRNALFIAPEAPAAPEESPCWSTLRRLLNVVFRTAHIKEPSGPLVVVGHSGAYRTLVPWLDEPALHQLILIDALYGNEPDFLDWLGRARINHMTLVVKGTAKWADPFVKRLPYAVTVPRIPRAITDLSRAERAAKLLCLRSQYGHFELITEGRTMPVLLGRAGLKTCRHAALKEAAAPTTLHRGRRRAARGR